MYERLIEHMENLRSRIELSDPCFIFGGARERDHEVMMMKKLQSSKENKIKGRMRQECEVTGTPGQKTFP